jgi:hypothetical protein
MISRDYPPRGRTCLEKHIKRVVGTTSSIPSSSIRGTDGKEAARRNRATGAKRTIELDLSPIFTLLPIAVGSSTNPPFPMSVDNSRQNVRRSLRGDGFESPQLHQPVAPDWRNFPVSGMTRHIRGLRPLSSVSMRLLAVSRTRGGRFRPKVSGGRMPFPEMLLRTIWAAWTGSRERAWSRPYFDNFAQSRSELAKTDAVRMLWRAQPKGAFACQSVWNHLSGLPASVNDRWGSIMDVKTQ